MNDYKKKMKHYPHRAYFITLHPHQSRYDEIENEERTNNFIQEWFRRKAKHKSISNAEPPALLTETEHDQAGRPHTHSILVVPRWLSRYGIQSSDFTAAFSRYADNFYNGSHDIQPLPTPADYERALRYTQKEKRL